MVKAKSGSRKVAIQGYDDLAPEVLAGVKSIHDDLDVLRESKKLTELRGELKKVTDQLNGYYAGPSEGGVKMPDADSDAAAIVAGTMKVGDLTCPIDAKDSLRRQEAALTTAVQIQEGKFSEAYMGAIRRGCQDVEPIAVEFIKDTLAAFEQVRAALRRQEKFFAFLSRQGFDGGKRPSHWQSWPYELQTLYGGIYSLDYYLQERRRAWKLDGEISDKGKR